MYAAYGLSGSFAPSQSPRDAPVRRTIRQEWADAGWMEDKSARGDLQRRVEAAANLTFTRRREICVREPCATLVPRARP
jgi:hypothetical protein